MVLFYAFVRRDSVSLLRFPFLSHVKVFLSEISLCCLKCPYHCFSSHFCFLVIFVLLMLVSSVSFLVVVISLTSHFFMYCYSYHYHYQYLFMCIKDIFIFYFYLLYLMASPYYIIIQCDTVSIPTAILIIVTTEKALIGFHIDTSFMFLFTIILKIWIYVTREGFYAHPDYIMPFLMIFSNIFLFGFFV